MIKLISKNNLQILAFKVTHDLEKDDVDWLVKRISNREDRFEHSVFLYVEFEDFGELTFTRVWDHFKMFMDHIVELVQKVSNIAIVSSNDTLKNKLSLEFSLVPTVSLKCFNENEDSAAVEWLENKITAQRSLG